MLLNKRMVQVFRDTWVGLSMSTCEDWWFKQNKAAMPDLVLPFPLQDTATSYGFGAVGSVVYLRMLNRSMDGVGGIGAALGQPRLLVPIILTAAFNRYNPAHKCVVVLCHLRLLMLLWCTI